LSRAIAIPTIGPNSIAINIAPMMTAGEILHQAETGDESSGDIHPQIRAGQCGAGNHRFSDRITSEFDCLKIGFGDRLRCVHNALLRHRI
jgi:hypothetical protein